MSLPNYLARIKSSGMYRFTFDKSQVPPQAAETMRLVVGYSEKGPFNNPVYIDNKADFINLFGKGSKRLEKKGVFFHRLALQALSAGPILALNLKKFNSEKVGYIVTDSLNNVSATPAESDLEVSTLFDTNRFWKLDADQLPDKLGDASKYINIAATDTDKNSCSLFFADVDASEKTQYNVTIRDWYKGLDEELPEYLETIADDKVSDYLKEIYVFRGKFTKEVATSLNGGADTKRCYFTINDESITLNGEYENPFTGKGAKVALIDLSSNSNSNFVGLYRGVVLPYFKDQFGNYISIDIVFNADKDTHKMMMKLDDSKITDNILEGLKTAITPSTAEYVEGYAYTTSDDPANDSLEMLLDKGIYSALTNHVDSEYHYIIDTYMSAANNGLVKGASSTSKTNIVEVAKAKDNCLAIMNFPTWNDINTDDVDTLKSKFVLPGESQGASYCAYYTPLVMSDGTVKTTIPSAALVSNNFMEKWNSRQPYYIVAGPNYGVMSYDGLVGPDYNYSKADLDLLEPYGVNAMVYVPRKGTYINSNQTAKQTPVSALSKVHVRELVIFLQNEIENMMQNYQWEMNTQTLRDTIKTKADTILERIKNNGGVYEYLNVCDGTNNTPEVIDNEMVILDTSIEPARGAGKMVQRLTIHRTGGISSLTK